MDSWFRLVVAVLAAWRITHTLAHEDGPADVFRRMRDRLGGSWPGRMLACFECLSVWVAAPLAAFVSVQPLPWLFCWLAVSGGACIIERFASEPLVIQPLTEDELKEADDGMLRSRPAVDDDPARVEGETEVAASGLQRAPGDDRPRRAGGRG